MKFATPNRNVTHLALETIIDSTAIAMELKMVSVCPVHLFLSLMKRRTFLSQAFHDNNIRVEDVIASIPKEVQDFTNESALPPIPYSDDLKAVINNDVDLCTRQESPRVSTHHLTLAALNLDLSEWSNVFVRFKIDQKVLLEELHEKLASSLLDSGFEMEQFSPDERWLPIVGCP
jgi:ATP-dependent Clp protease ATP-binding subunit ClpA